MRSGSRLQLATRPAKWLLLQRTHVMTDLTIDVKDRWRARRNTMKNNGVVATLRDMAGWRERCMYCGDSEGCDVEHYRPKSESNFRQDVFDWVNLLWICQPCNRRKGDRFPIAANGAPLLLDPTIHRGWDYFDFVPETGYLVCRVDITGIARKRAEATLDEQLTRLNHEVILNERKRAARQLARAAKTFLASDRSASDEKEFFSACIDAGYPELCEWFYVLQGSSDQPFRDVIQAFPGTPLSLKVALNSFFPEVWL